MNLDNFFSNGKIDLIKMQLIINNFFFYYFVALSRRRRQISLLPNSWSSQFFLHFDNYRTDYRLYKTVMYVA